MPRLLVIGGGVGAWAFLRALEASSVVDRFDDIHQVEAPALAPPCSIDSTAVAALRGTRVGLSELGDELVADWAVARTILPRLAGATHAKLTTACWEERDQRRFQHLARAAEPPLPLADAAPVLALEEAWIIDPPQVLASLRAACSRVRTRQAFVKGWETLGDRTLVRFLDGPEENYDQVVVCAGAWTGWLMTPSPAPRSVRGTFARWDEVAFGAESFAFTVDGINLIYRADARVLLLGASTEVEDGRLWPDAAIVREQWAKVAAHLAIPLPAWEDATLHTGMRQRGPQRRPFIHAPAPNVLVAGGLYKNGWVSAWGQAERLLARLSESLGPTD